MYYCRLQSPSLHPLPIQEIYSIYLRSGYLYHSAHNLSPGISAAANTENLTLFRGCAPENKYLMSGLGFYTDQECDAEKSISDLFGLQTDRFDSYLMELLSGGDDWKPIEWPENTEFLRLEAPFSRGYWKPVPDKDHQVSIARYGAPTKLYVFYYYQNSNGSRYSVAPCGRCDPAASPQAPASGAASPQAPRENRRPAGGRCKRPAGRQRMPAAAHAVGSSAWT